jgi:Fanconi-associated nuclease 1
MFSRISGPCIILNDSVRALFEKVHFIYYRESGESNLSAMTAAILVRTSRRTFPSYVVCRSRDFWPDRKHLVDYYEAVKVYKDLTNLVENLDASRKSDRAQSIEKWRLKEAATLSLAWSLCESIFEKWQAIIKEKITQSKPNADWEESRLYFRKRFEAGKSFASWNGMPHSGKLVV